MERGLGRLKYWAYLKSQQRRLFQSSVTNLSIARLTKRLAETLKERRPVPIESISTEAVESEIEVYYLEALLEYNNVFKEAHPDRPVEDVKSDAKKAALECFMKSSRSKRGNPVAYNKYLNLLFENFKQKDFLLKTLAAQVKLT